ncbi:MAG: beta-ketoacyl synthase chain length factor [Bacteroidetes bacterium]|nr:beta-ketoacyl synthase chain length factor [Bacteroidota bacterium]
MGVYIQGIGNISAQIFDPRSQDFTLHAGHGNRLICIEPDYKDMIPPMQLRRMSKIVRMGIACAKAAMQDAGIVKPDTISLGTAYGCLADTEFFLQKLITQDESMLTPTAFIQSTHNTVSGQIALLLNCTGHNFTYVHRGHSFETTLQEAFMLTQENVNCNALIGGIDELTNNAFNIISRFGTYKKEDEHFNNEGKGCIAGEGANLFVVNAKDTKSSYAYCSDIHVCSTENIAEELDGFLHVNQLQASDIDTCLLGLNGDERYDTIIANNIRNVKNARTISFKKYCGEYPSSGAFAMALACKLLQSNTTPMNLQDLNAPLNDEPAQRVLIYNHYKNQYHSFILLNRL